MEFGTAGERLRTVRRLVRSGPAETVALTYTPAGTLQRAEYRNLSEYRTLVLNFESINDAAPFPEDTWSPGGAR